MIEPTEKRGSTGVLGSVGDDLYGRIYTELLEQESIEAVFQEFEDKTTGICGVFCHEKDRGHVTDLGASTLVSDEFVESNWEKIQDVQLIFTELFILKHRQNIVFKLAELGLHNEKIFGFNFPSFYFIETFLSEIKQLLENADIIFSNAAEAAFFAQLMGLETDNFGLICEFIAKYPKKNPSKRRTVVITCGPDPAYVCEFDHVTHEISFSGTFKPEYVNEDDIVDTNGAGDAFAGGFLSKYMPGRSLDECMKAGHYAAAIVIQKRGCQYPQKCDFQKN
jgi:adenosine kinase